MLWLLGLLSIWMCLCYCSVPFQGSHPTWKTWKTLNFVIFFSKPGKCLEFAQKVIKTWNFNSEPGQKLKLRILFQTSLFKMLFTKINLTYMTLSYLHYQHKHWFEAKLILDFIAFLGNNLENTWNLGPKTLRKPGIWYLEKSGNPAFEYGRKDTILYMVCGSVLYYASDWQDGFLHTLAYQSGY